MKKFLAENWIVILIGVALLGSMSMAIRNNYIITENYILQKQSEQVKQLADQILSNTIHGLDLGARGFGLTKEQTMLEPFNQSIKRRGIIFHKLDSLITIQNYPDRAKLKEVDFEVSGYIDFSKNMVAMAEIDSMRTFVDMLREDKGYGVWKKYDDFTKPLFAFEDSLNKEALANYNAAIRSNMMLQISIIVLALPALLMFVRRVRKEKESRQHLVKEVEENDKKYVFNSGSDETLTAEQVNEASINNSRKASNFIKSLATGKYDVEWDGLNQNNITLNQETLAGNLIDLRKQLQKVKQDDDRRNSTNEGLAQFSELVRNTQHDPSLLADKCISFLVKKIGAQQGSLFVLEGEGSNRHLKLISCFAFNKKKYVEKKIEIGVGLVGQVFLEGDFAQLKDIPQGYTTITSGLGECTPGHLLILPLKYDKNIVGVLEVASLSNCEEHQIDFLKKASEFLASAFITMQTTTKMKILLDQSVINEDRARKREEELRQNMEELMATQEELVRKEREVQLKVAY